MDKAYVIGCSAAGFSKNKIIYFRKVFNARRGEDFDIKIFAEAGYKLYLNGNFIGAGPTKRNELELYYDERSLGGFLKDGENELTVSVLALARPEDLPGHRFVTSLLRSGAGALEISGTLGGKLFITDSSWECAVEAGVEFTVPEYAYYTGAPEYVRGKLYNKPSWEKATVLLPPERYIFCGEPSLWFSKPSPIPLQKNIRRKIELVCGETIDFKHMVSAYLEIAMKGKGRVSITYAERCAEPGSDDREKGEAFGDRDIIELDGSMVFKPYRSRCFRFIRLEAEGDVEIVGAVAYETGYPLKVSDDYDFGTDEDNKLWEISRRTLELCMTDTYNDCPYYEQLQYTMDTYLQCVYTYQISGDDRLWRRAIRDFAMSMGADGLTQCRTPSAQKQYIPGFSLFYVLMVAKHYEFCRDFEVVDENLPHIMRIFSWYRKHLDEKCLLRKSIYWHFIDWADDFAAGRGLPTMEEGASLGVESLILCCALRAIAKILGGGCYKSLAEDYKCLADKINATADEYYFCEAEGLYANTEHRQHFCQHMQIWAVLSGCATGVRARTAMEKSFSLTGRNASFAYAYFLFRALEKTGLYDKREEMLAKLRRLTGLNCTTIPETPEEARSECHAWGAVALYEFTAMDLGVRREGERIVIRPYTKDRASAHGSVYVNGQPIFVSWKMQDGVLYIYTDSELADIDADCRTVRCKDRF